MSVRVRNLTDGLPCAVRLLPENYAPYILEQNEEMNRIGRGPAAKVHLPPATRTAPALSRA
jgi:hypothetical protein